MGIFKKLFGIKKPEHAVIVHFLFGLNDLSPIFALEDQLESAISNAGVGEYDGNELAADGSDGILYMYGPDGDRLFDVIRPILELSPFMKGAKVIIRYGPPTVNTRQREVIIGA